MQTIDTRNPRDLAEQAARRRSNELKFRDIQIGEIFCDFAYSGMWMQKIDAESARFEDGLIGLIGPDSPVSIG